MINPTKVVADWEQDYKLMQDQRAEIERLRLTDGERAAMQFAIEAYPLDDSVPSTLRRFLERTK